MAIGVFRIYLSRTWTDPVASARLLQALDALPSFLYRIDRIADADLAAIGNDAEALGSAVRVAMTQSHVALVQATGTGDVEQIWAIELELARTGFRRRMPVLAIATPGPQSDKDPGPMGSDRLVAFDGPAIASAIQELAEAAAAERRATDLTRRPKAIAAGIVPAKSPSKPLVALGAPRTIPYAEIAAAFASLQAARARSKPSP